MKLKLETEKPGILQIRWLSEQANHDRLIPPAESKPRAVWLPSLLSEQSLKPLAEMRLASVVCHEFRNNRSSRARQEHRRAASPPASEFNSAQKLFAQGGVGKDQDGFAVQLGQETTPRREGRDQLICRDRFKPGGRWSSRLGNGRAGRRLLGL